MTKDNRESDFTAKVFHFLALPSKDTLVSQNFDNADRNR